MPASPLVSVYIPTHNRSGLIKRAVDSVLAQTYKSIEVLVCSDGSTDDTDQVMAEYVEQYPNVKYFKNESPQGACSARNVCINNASGEYITGLDDDDIFHPQRIELLIANIEESDSFICSALLQWDLNKKDVSTFLSSNFTGVKSSKVTLEQMLLDNVVGNQIFARSDKLRSIGGFCEEMPAWQDYDTWVRMLLTHGDAKKITAPLYIADIDRTRNRITSSNKRLVGCTKFYERYWHLMNHQQRKNAQLRIAIFKQEKLPLWKLISLFNLGDVKNWLRASAIKCGYKL